MQTITLSHNHGYQPAATYHHCGKSLVLNVRYSADKVLPFWVSIDYFRHPGKDPGINTLRFCQAPHGAGKVASLPGVDDSNVNPPSLKRTSNSSFKSTSGFHQDQCYRVLSQFSNNGIETVRVIGSRKLHNITAGVSVTYWPY